MIKKKKRKEMKREEKKKNEITHREEDERHQRIAEIREKNSNRQQHCGERAMRWEVKM